MSAADHLSELQFVHEHGRDSAKRISARANGVKVGHIDYHLNEHYFGKPVIYPDDVHVAEEHRRKGVGTALHGAVLAAHPDRPMVHVPEVMSESAVAMLPKLQQAHPGRHEVHEELPWREHRQAASRA